ncbi:MAG: 23S rRNA (guanosine(2251)-2'-O)-methyltransferase RlmB [Limnobacter sp.]|nr:23S rRNA (guanosine(2251)-2'-O)-methyltransferase RlmB [Limnobacter sp.]
MAIVFGFHAVLARVRQAPASVNEVLFDTARRDKRMQQAIEKCQQAGVKCTPADKNRLEEAAGHTRHQGLLALVQAIEQATDLNTLIAQKGASLLLLVLDGITDPHNFGACLRSADAAGVHGVIIPKDKSVGVTPVVSKVACGAAETLPVFSVTNLARTLRDIQEEGVWCIGTAGEATENLYALNLRAGPTAWVVGAEGDGLRRLTRETCDQLVHIPMVGAVESLNVSVAASVCLFETLRQRQFLNVSS